MKRVPILAIAALLALASGTAMAFDMQQGAKAPAPGGGAAPPVAKETDLGANLSLTETQKAPSGTEVRIPGLGRLGVLPKLDFGLELLYGATDNKQQPDTPANEHDNLVVRGTVKHRF